jgi:hypothetical protein
MYFKADPPPRSTPFTESEPTDGATRNGGYENTLKRFYISLAVVAVAVLVSSLFFAAETFFLHQPQAEVGKPEFYVGVQCGYENVTLCKELIDRTKNYTNLFIIGSSGLVRNITLLDEACDYAYAAGLHFSMYFSSLQDYSHMGENVSMPGYLSDGAFGNITQPTREPIGWLKNAIAKYGDKFLGAYFWDEPGGNQLDNNAQS